MTETLNEIFDRMPTVFTSNNFANTAIKRKVISKKEVENGIVAGYLIGKNCIRISGRTWQKEGTANVVTQPKLELDNKSEVPSVKPVSEFLNKLPLDKVIAFVQSKGYIVLAP